MLLLLLLLLLQLACGAPAVVELTRLNATLLAELVAALERRLSRLFSVRSCLRRKDATRRTLDPDPPAACTSLSFSHGSAGLVSLRFTRDPPACAGALALRATSDALLVRCRWGACRDRHAELQPTRELEEDECEEQLPALMRRSERVGWARSSSGAEGCSRTLLSSWTPWPTPPPPPLPSSWLHELYMSYCVDMEADSMGGRSSELSCEQACRGRTTHAVKRDTHALANHHACFKAAHSRLLLPTHAHA